MSNWPRRFMIEAWISSNVCVHYVASNAWMTFEQIYQTRPDDCRYAVLATMKAENVADYTTDGHFIVIDLFACMTPGFGQIEMPQPLGLYNDLDTAIMTAALLCGD